MPVTDSTSTTAPEHASEMYWTSDRTVEEIVKELNISRSALYSAVRPIPADMSCPQCGDAMVFTNRSNRESHLATCRSCATQASTVGAPPREEPRAAHLHPEEGKGSRRGSGSWAQWRGQLAAVSPQRVAMVGSAAALGVVLGAVVTRLVRGLI
jgi:hypothetical protein